MMENGTSVNDKPNIDTPNKDSKDDQNNVDKMPRRKRYVPVRFRNMEMGQSDEPEKTSSVQMKMKISSQSGEKNFKCKDCCQLFATRLTLQEHMLRHTDSKPYKCEVCKRPFRQVSCLKRHMATHSTDAPHKCEVCGRTFTLTVYLKSHMRCHTGEKPYKCKSCAKRFAHQSDLNRHQSVHTGEKKFVCETCGAKFTDASSCRRHMKEHLGYKPYSCQQCGDSFKRAAQLSVHQLKKHDEAKETDKQNQPPVVPQGVQLGSIIVDPGKQAGLPEETQQIIQHIQSQIDQHSDSPQPFRVAYQILHDDDNQQIVEIQYQALDGLATEHEAQLGSAEEVQVNVSCIEDLAPIEEPDNTEPMVTESETPGKPESQDNITAIKSVQVSSKYVAHPDFDSQEFYDWLSDFTTHCKTLSFPLDNALFKDITRVQKQLSDVLAAPVGFVACKLNFKVLLSFSRELSAIINDHLDYVYENLK